MKKYRFTIGILPLLLFLFPLQFQAQAPGYLGKKLYLEFSTGLGPATNGPTQNNRGNDNLGSNPDDDKFGINYTFDLSLNLVVQRYNSISITAGQYYTGMVTRFSTPSVGDALSTDFHENLHRLNVRTIGIRYVSFRRSKGALAPIGRHFSIGLEKIFARGEIIDRIVDYNGPFGATQGHAPLNFEQNYNPFALVLAWHKTSLLFDRLILKTGLATHFPITISPVQYLSSNYDAHSKFAENPRQAQFEVETYNRLFKHGLLRFEIGVGLLLF